MARGSRRSRNSRQYEMRDLVQETHGIERGRVHYAVGIVVRVANRFHPAREIAARGQIDEDDVRRERE